MKYIQVVAILGHLERVEYFSNFILFRHEQISNPIHVFTLRLTLGNDMDLPQDAHIHLEFPVT